MRVPEYDGLVKKKAAGGMDFSLRSKIYEINRDADRRYAFATQNVNSAIEKGEKFPQSSPLQEIWGIKNDDQASHDEALKVIEFFKKAVADPSCPEDAKPYMQHWIDKGIPAVGEDFELLLPQVMVNQADWLYQTLYAAQEENKANMTESAFADWQKKVVPEVFAKVMGKLQTDYKGARDLVQKQADMQKAFFRSQKERP